MTAVNHFQELKNELRARLDSHYQGMLTIINTTIERAEADMRSKASKAVAQSQSKPVKPPPAKQAAKPNVDATTRPATPSQSKPIAANDPTLMSFLKSLEKRK